MWNHVQEVHIFQEVFITLFWCPSVTKTGFFNLTHEEYQYMKQGAIFEYIFWSTTNKNLKLGQYKGNNFQESFEQFGGLVLSSRYFSIWQPAPINQQLIMSRFQCSIFFLKERHGTIKNIKNNQISLYLHYNKFIKEPRTSF